jgi:hypothetical protein
VGASARVTNVDLNNGTGTASGTALYEHTINWGGISSVVDSVTGEPDTDWSVTSASGFDYTNAVPEPSSIVLAAIGCIACLAVAHRKTASPDRVQRAPTGWGDLGPIQR